MDENNIANMGALVISGSSTGIGKTCALLLDKMGSQVFTGVRKRRALYNEAHAQVKALQVF